MTTETAVRERPILFSGEMVRAILDGRKTQTRRVIAKQPAGAWAAPGKTACPYGAPGDRLWVRETWQSDHAWPDDDGERENWWHEQPAGFRGPGSCKYVYYAADNAILMPLLDVGGLHPSSWEPKAEFWDSVPWRPSIHMPRWASRLTLEITEVRVQRLQEISAADVVDEGVWVDPPAGALVENQQFPPDFEKWLEWRKAAWFRDTARATHIARVHHGKQLVAEFRKLWDSLNAKRGYSWDSNPWVWAISFQPLTTR